MALQLIYLMFSKVRGWIVLHTSCTRSDATKDIEIPVLRHQLAVLQRRTPRPQITWTDRVLIAALTRLLPVRGRLGLVVTRPGVGCAGVMGTRCAAFGARVRGSRACL